MSSTTDRHGQRGQVLVLFAGAIVTLLLIAALAFDVGMMLLERRDQQNAADAAALGGARYVLASPIYHGTCAGAAGNQAAAAACDLAVVNGFVDADSNENVIVHIPPAHGIYKGFYPGFVEVQIEATRPSIFAGVIGRTMWPVGVYAVAANQQGITYSFGMLALNPTACKAIHIAGTGTVISGSNIHSNSTGADCGDGSNIGFSRSGGGILDVLTDDLVCRSAGEIQDQGSGWLDCAPIEYSFALPDPLRNLAAPAKPGLAPPLQEVGVAGPPPNVPDYCPGANDANPVPPSETSPSKCVLGQGGAQAGRQWILSPGLYPGGLELKGGVRAYLLPGIYWIGGGGLQTSGDAWLVSVANSAVLTPGGGGVMIYNSKLPAAAGDSISMGGGGAVLDLHPLALPATDADAIYNEIVIFQDRTVASTVVLNGSDSNAASVRGIVYVPAGHVQVNGANSVFTMDQVIADTFKINGSGGTVKVLREMGVDAEISGVGLVE